MRYNSKLDKEYKVRDPIYGFIRLDAQEMDIVNTPYFQRLRRIKQLSLTDMIYPGASHSRFEHSLGVMQMASDMFDNIVRKESNLRRLSLRSGSLDRSKKIIRLAALLHDIGHAPFAHAGEELMPCLSNSKIKYTHEDYSIAIIKLLFRGLIENHPFGENLGVKVEDVTLLLGDQTVPPTIISVIWKELLSGQLDADRADYLLRDSLHIGVNYGLYDRALLVNSITIGESEEESCFLAVEERGWHVAESIVIARYQMFAQVYFHQVRRIFDFHASEALREVLKLTNLDSETFPMPTTKHNVQQYLDFDEWKVFGLLKEGKGGKHGNIILNRTPYKCIGSWLDDELTEDELRKAREHEERYGGYLDLDVSTKWYKLDRDIKVFDDKTGNSFPLSYKSKLIRIMPSLPKMTRLYVEQKDGGAYFEFELR